MPVRLAFLIVCAVTAASAQGLQCVALSSAPIVHAEGITERVGDITMNCSNGQPNQPVTGNLNIFLSVNITNRLTAQGFTDIVLSIDNGSGPVVANVAAGAVANNQAVFNGLSFTLSPQGTAVIRIENVRGNATQSRGGIVMQLAFNGSSLPSVFTSQFTVAVPLPAFLGSTPGRLLCSIGGSPYPSFENSLVGFVTAGSSSSTFRLTEGFASSFTPKSDQANFRADAGVRFIFKYSGYPAGARIYVPDIVVGTDGLVPTSTGDMGLPLSGGVFNAGSSALLLSRVAGADITGANGSPLVIAPPGGSGPYAFDTVHEVDLANGAGFVVFEVISADQFSLQSAQVPTFLTLTPGAVGSTFQTQLEVNLAAISSNQDASISAAVPRFARTTPANDCVAIGDCAAPYFPALDVTLPNPLKFFVNAGGGSQVLFLPIKNVGGGVMPWSVSTVYNEVNGWLRLDPAVGFNNGTVRVEAIPAGLSPGVYTATVRVNTGASGSVVVPVQMTVSNAPASAPPIIRSVTNAANDGITVLVPGSRAAINGDRLNGANLLVAIDGIPVAVLEQQRTRLLILVPPALAGKSVAILTAAADGSATTSFVVNLADVAPAILPGGVLNLDYSVNNANAPALAGTAFQIFATGLPLNGAISGRVHDVDIFDPLYAGPAPGAIGVQQVNLQIHSQFLTFQTFVYVCGQAPGASRICSPAVPIWLQAKP